MIGGGIVGCPFKLLPCFLSPDWRFNLRFNGLLFNLILFKKGFIVSLASGIVKHCPSPLIFSAPSVQALLRILVLLPALEDRPSCGHLIGSIELGFPVRIH